MFGKQPLITASTPDAHKGMQTETRHCYVLSNNSLPNHHHITHYSLGPHFAEKFAGPSASRDSLALKSVLHFSSSGA
jgi:hypothetical protein